MAKKTDKKTAVAEIQKQLKRLEATLNEIMDNRRENELAIKESRAETQKLLQLDSKMAAKEGKLRKQIGELETALKGLRQ